MIGRGKTDPVYYLEPPKRLMIKTVSITIQPITNHQSPITNLKLTFVCLGDEI